jgi:hypothetical protein
LLLIEGPVTLQRMGRDLDRGASTSVEEAVRVSRMRPSGGGSAEVMPWSSMLEIIGAHTKTSMLGSPAIRPHRRIGGSRTGRCTSPQPVDCQDGTEVR